jgi:hypothetical protein
MCKRILVPWNGSAPAEAVLLSVQDRAKAAQAAIVPCVPEDPAAENPFSAPSIFVPLEDELETGKRNNSIDITNRVEHAGKKTSFSIRKNQITEAIQTVADAIVDMTRMFTLGVQMYSFGYILIHPKQ